MNTILNFSLYLDTRDQVETSDSKRALEALNLPQVKGIDILGGQMDLSVLIQVSSGAEAKEVSKQIKEVLKSISYSELTQL